ncbi:MAG: hypothetical protein HY606_12240 [Planctomycetes bacterium]|nr:hypothetical protein [Planctomycetota bacterium]
MKPKRYIVWSKKKISLRDPYQKRWDTKQVLCHGRAEDISGLDWDYIKCNLKDLDLPPDIRRLWETYFDIN